MAGYLGNAVYRRLQPNQLQKVAEVGVFDGPTSAWLLARLPNLTLFMVDQWEPYTDSNQPDATLNADKWVRVKRMAHSRTDFAKDRRVVLNFDSVKAASHIPDASLDMAFIDANHTLTGVRRDLEAYWPKVRPNGWLAGHDWEKHEPRIYGVVQAVQEFAKKVGLEYELDEDATWFIRKPMEYGSKPSTVEQYAGLIVDRKHFAQANYGDGEWGCLLGHDGLNCNGEVYSRKLGEALRLTLREPCGMWCGTNPGPKLRKEAETWVDAQGVRAPWRYKEVLPEANAQGRLAPFLAACRTRNVLLVGPRHLENLPPTVLDPSYHFVVPDQTAHERADEIAGLVAQEVESGDLVLFAAGMATNLMIHRLWPGLKDRVTLLDVGATLDPYAGVLSRQAYMRPEFQQAITKNLAAA